MFSILFCFAGQLNKFSIFFSSFQASWVAGINNIIAFFGNLIFGYITPRFGRKIPLLLIALPNVVSFQAKIKRRNEKNHEYFQ